MSVSTHFQFFISSRLNSPSVDQLHTGLITLLGGWWKLLGRDGAGTLITKATIPLVNAKVLLLIPLDVCFTAAPSLRASFLTTANDDGYLTLHA